LKTSSGARAYYDRLQRRDIGHHAALTNSPINGSASRGCLTTATLYNDATAPPR
jgi:hypothetical protein